MLKVMKSLFFVLGTLLVQYVLIKKSIRLMKCIVFWQQEYNDTNYFHLLEPEALY